jgi:F-type H+-transporting ATPase subunit b
MAFVIQVINFCVLAIALNIFLYKPIRRVMAERRETIESSRDRAEAVDRDVREKMALYEARLQDARNEAVQRKAEAIRQAQAEEAALLEKARSDAAATLATIRERVARESAEAREILIQQAQTLSGDVCEKILGRSL